MVAVFRDGTAGAFDTALGEQANDFLIAQRCGGVLAIDQIADDALDICAGQVFAVIGGNAGGKEFSDFDDAAGPSGEFSGYGSGNGCFVDTDLFCDICHDEGADVGRIAGIEECLLVFDDEGGDAAERQLAQAHAIDERLRIGDALAGVVAIGLSDFRQSGFVLLGSPELRGCPDGLIEGIGVGPEGCIDGKTRKV